MQWEQFLDLLTVEEVMLFIFGRLLVSGSAPAPGARGPDMHSKCPVWKKPTRCPRTGGAHSLSFTLRFLLWDSVPTTHFLNLSIHSLPCLLFLSILSVFSTSFFSPPLYLSTNPHHIHHWSLTSICCLTGISRLVIVFPLDLAGLYSLMVCCLLTNVSDSPVSIAAVK